MKAMFLVFLAVAQAKPAPPPPPPGRVIFVRGDALMEVPGDGKGEVELAKLPAEIGAPVAIDASPDGKLIVVRGATGSAWRVDGEAGGAWHLACAGSARPSPTSECLLCEAGGKLRLMGANEKLIVEVPGTLHEVNFLGSGRELAALVDEGVVGFPTRKPAETRKLAEPGATSHLLVAPDGGRAVAVFGHGKESRVYGFELDGKGVPRRLGGPGTPIMWSWDSAWVLIDEGSAPREPDEGGEDDGGGEEEEGVDGGGGEGASNPWLMGTPGGKDQQAKKKKAPEKKKKAEEPRAKVRACAVRASGGESKCWNHYAGRGFSPEVGRVLLWKDGALWIGKIPGVRAEAPRKLIEKADGPAIWLP